MFHGREAPGRAGGGRVLKGLPYTVGEVRREVFVPDTNGRIVANPALRTASRGNDEVHRPNTGPSLEGLA
jgi:hypothetical protein